MTRDEIRAALGQPDDCDTGSRRRTLPVIYKYRDFELHFEEGPEGGLKLVYLEDDDGQPHTLLSKENNNDRHRR
jgi:hypothetical protein